MTVRELGNFLLKHAEEHGDSLVVLSKDSEGNSFSPLPNEGFFNFGHYIADSTWSGEFVGEENVDDEDEQDESEETEQNGVPAMVLWPTN